MLEVPYRAKVTAHIGSAVQMRSFPTDVAKTIEMIPVGETVDVLYETNDGWGYINDSGVTGYMMKKFLSPVQEEKHEEKKWKIPVDAEMLKELRKCLSAAMTMVDEILNRIDFG